MSLMKCVRWGGVAVTVIAIAACSSTGFNKWSKTSGNQGNAAYNNEVSTSGTGEELGFGENGEGTHANSDVAKRIYHFAFDSDAVREEDKSAIVANADYLIKHPQVNVILEGHTDPRGSREYNIGLGERRAKAVADILTSRGVKASQVRLVSYGSEKPAVHGQNEAAYAQDRRVVLALI